MNVERISIESDERGFELHIDSDEGNFVFNIEGVYESLYNQARARILPHLVERDEVKRAFECNPSYEEFMRDEYAHERQTGQHAEDSGYDRDDPKHPDWHSVHADIWDNREPDGQRMEGGRWVPTSR